MKPPSRRSLAVCLLVLTFLALRLPALLSLAPTQDEMQWIGAGEQLVREGPSDLTALVDAPPLAAHLTSVPLWFLIAPEKRLDDARRAPASTSAAAVYDSVTFINQQPVTPWTVLLLTRLPVLLVGLLGMEMLRRTGQRFFDDGTGWIAAAAWALHPGLSGYGVLATPDVVATVAGLFLFVSFVDYHDASGMRGAGSRRRLWRLGLAAGLALASRHVMILPVAALVLASVVLRFIKQRRGETVRSGAAGRFVLAGCIALFTLWALYGFDFRPLGWSELPTQSAQLAALTGIDSGALHDTFAEVAVPFATYIQTQLLAFVHVAGSPSMAAPYPWAASQGILAAGVATTPLALLTLGGLGLIGWWQLRRDRADLPDLVLLFVVLLIGGLVPFRPELRPEHLLPALPFVFLLGAGAVRRLADSAPRSAGILVLVLGVLCVAEVVPHVGDPAAFRHVFASPPQDASLEDTAADTELRPSAPKFSLPLLPRHARDRGQDLWRVLAVTEGLGVERLECVFGADPDVLRAEAFLRPELEGPSPELALHAAAVRADQQEYGTSEGFLLAVAEDALGHPDLARLAKFAPMLQSGRVRIYRVALPPRAPSDPSDPNLPAGAVPENSR